MAETPTIHPEPGTSPHPGPAAPPFWRRTSTHWCVVPLLLVADLAAVYFAHRLALWLRISLLATGEPIPPAPPYERLATVSMAVSLVLMTVLGLYAERAGQSRWRERMQVGTASLGVGMIDLAIVFFDRRLTTDGFTFSRAAWFFMIGFCWLLLTLGRGLTRRIQGLLRQRGWGVRRTLIIGADGLARLVARRQLAEPSLGYALIGFAADEGLDPELPAPWLGRTTDLDALIVSHAIDTVIIAVPELPRTQLLTLISICRVHEGVQVQLVPDILEFLTTKIRISDLSGLPMVGLQTTPLQQWYNRLLKRTFDVGIAGIALLVLGPLLLIIAATVKWTSAGPVFYRQERLSRGGQRFEILKFRTMRPDAEAATGPIWSPASDARRTPVGRWLRRSSLDELPQLLNVLKGDMSIVGPRPERPFFTGQFEKQVIRYDDRHLVLSGMTGWAQIHGLRGDVPITDRTAHDLYYVENWSPWLDLQIILQSFRCVIDDYWTGRAG
ncbi:MAG: exopolysaccharide biosynthesis polyprenyl glycosylphosphotransferase [Candidatus Sericytochromatia bacterium]|nr:exopolysaccharide biosynthesis polyprenyl glycosylphosphotransferase [Candidatus Sericytochromatia bacterium]